MCFGWIELKKRVRVFCTLVALALGVSELVKESVSESESEGVRVCE